MINTSAKYKKAILENRILHHEAKIEFADGTVLTPVDEEMFTFKISDNCSGENSFDISSAIAKQLTLKIDNLDGSYDKHNFSKAKITARVGLEIDGVTEWLKKGVFYANPGEISGDTISVTANDSMTKFDKPYSNSKLIYPATLGGIVRDACSVCDVQMAADIASFDNSNYTVTSRPSDDSTTFRQVLQWVGEITGYYFKINENDKLTMEYYNTSLLESTEIETNSATALISDLGTGSKINTDDVVITGIRVTEETTSKSDTGKKSETVYTAGTTGYMLEIKENKLIQDGKGASVAKQIGKKLIGLTFRPVSLKCQSDPARESGDIAVVTDRKGKKYKTILTGVTYTAKASQGLLCGAVSPERLSATRYSKATQVYRELRKNLIQQRTEFEKALDDLQNAMDEKQGLYPITEKQEDGSSILYFCDKPTKAESQVVIELNAKGWGMSTDGGKTWNTGVLVDGTAITKILNTIGLNADWINTGALKILDKNGNTLFLVDKDTNSVLIAGEVIQISGKTATQAIQDAIAQANAYTDGKSENLLKGYDLSAKNLEKYWTVSGTVTQGQPDPSGGKKAVLLTGTDATDNFISANYSNNNPLSSGKGKYNFSVYLKASAARTISITFNRKEYSCDVTTSWKKFRFTEEIETPSTSGNNFEIGGFSSVPKGVKLYAYMPFVVRSYTAQEIFNLLTNSGKIQGLTMVDGKLYFNASYINSGDMSANRIRGGILTLGGKDNGNGIFRLLDASGNPVVTMFNNGLRVYTSYTDDSHYSYLQFSRTGIKPVIKDGGNETIWKNGIEPSSNWIIRYTSDGKIIINADKMNTDSLAAGTAVINKTLSVLGDTGLRGDAYVAGALAFKDYFEETQKSDTRRRPVASASGSGKRTAYISSIIAENGKKGISVKGQYGGTDYIEWVFYGDASSDARLKENVRASQINALESINRMKFRSFTWRDTGIFQPLGLIADEIGNIDPLLTLGGGYNEDESMNVKQIDRLLLTEYAIKAIQELAETVQEQNDKIKELERRLNGC